RFRIPRRSNFVIVLNDVLIGAVESHGKRRAGAAGGALEARISSDHVVSQDAAIAPTANTQAIGIGDAHRNHVIDAGLQVLDFVMTPVGKNRTRVFLAAARAATIVYRQHGVAIRREHLALDAERMLILPVRSTVNAQ